jgi:predicted transcriptional regulator YdeE
MTLQIVQSPAFTMAGISTRTSNPVEMSGQGRIAQLWKGYLKDGGSPFPDQRDPRPTVSAYANYESDHTGEYDVTLGRVVAGPGEAGPGMKILAIPAGEYLRFPAADATPHGIISAWQAVYTHFAGPAEMRRAFTVDFEKYSAEGVHIYIAVRR